METTGRGQTMARRGAFGLILIASPPSCGAAL